jgi:hypothetical protein
LAIVFSVLHWFVSSDYSFGILKIWPLCSLSFIDLCLLITPLVSSNFRTENTMAKFWRYQRNNQKTQINEGQRTQWPKVWRYPISGTVHNKTLTKCILSLVQFTIKPWTNVSYPWYSSQWNLEQMYPIPGTVHNKTLNKCILSLVQFTIKPWTNVSYLWYSWQ